MHFGQARFSIAFARDVLYRILDDVEPLVNSCCVLHAVCAYCKGGGAWRSLLTAGPPASTYSC